MQYFRLTEESFVAGALRPEGYVVQYDAEASGAPSFNMMPATKQEWEAQQHIDGHAAAVGGFSPAGGSDHVQTWRNAQQPRPAQPGDRPLNRTAEG